MDKDRLQYIKIGGLTLFWLTLVVNIMLKINGCGQLIYPKPSINKTLIIGLITSTLLLLRSLYMQAKYEYSIEKSIAESSLKKIFPLFLLMLISVPFVYSYVFEQEFHSIGQMILNIETTLMDEDFDDLPPGSNPPGWDPLDGTWSTSDDGGNIVYYQDDNSDKEALSISTTGNSSWTDYSFEVDLKFVEGNTKKDERGALLIFRYQGGNSYYFLWLKEAMDTLELHNRGDGAHIVTSTSCTLVPDTWYHVNCTIIGQSVWVSIDYTPYFTNIDMSGALNTGNVAIGTSYYKVMFDNILVEPII
jgi:hypothetical protein